MNSKNDSWLNETGFKRILIIFLCIAMLVGTFPTTVLAFEQAPKAIVWSGTVAANYSGGSGTSSDPYQISSADELAFLAESVNAGNAYKNVSFILTKEINLLEASWIPIGNDETIFEGNFNGNNHTIYNMHITSSDNNVGLFRGLGSSAFVENLIIDTAAISGNQYVGTIAGSNRGRISNCQIKSSRITGEARIGGVSGETCNSIENCTISKSEIEGNGNSIGGIVGYADFRGPYNYCIKLCRAENSKVIGKDSVGGIVGYKEQGAAATYYNLRIQQCYNSNSDVTGSSNVGGIIGSSYHFYTGDSINIEECYNSGSILGEIYVGGLVGLTIGQFNNGQTTIENGYNTGNVHATKSYAAGICGGTSKTIRNCYNVGGITSNETSASICAAPRVTTLGHDYYATIENCYYLDCADKNAEQLSREDFKVRESFKNWDFENIWTLSNKEYPQLKAIQINETEEELKEFNYWIYRADWLQSDLDGANTINHRLGLETPSIQMLKVLKEDDNFGNSLKAWESFDLFFSQLDKGPGTLYKKSCERQDVYQAIILEALHAELQEFLSDRAKKLYEEASTNVSVVLDQWKNTVGDLRDKGVFENLSKQNKKRLGEDLLKAIPHIDDIVDGFDYGLEFINAGVDLADCFETLCEHIYAGYVMIDMSNSLKTVVRDLYSRCPDNQTYLKKAIKSCVDVMDLSFDQFLVKVTTDTIVGLGKDAIVILSEHLWGCVKNVLQASFPWVDLFVGAYKVGKMLSNQLFNTDDVVEQYLHMTALVELEMLMDKTLSNFKTEYMDIKTETTAESYLNAVGLTLSLRILDCKDSCEFVDKIGEGIVNKIIYNKDEYKDLKDSFNGFRKDSEYAYTYFKIGWIEALKTDYPDLYPQFVEDQTEILKSIEIACPVDVYVYDKNNDLVAYVNGEKAWCSDKVSLELDNDKKKVYFYDSEDYRLEYIGNGSGDMDLTITEYDANESEARNVCFYNLPLQNGKEYGQNINGEVLQNKAYVIKSEQATIQSDIDTLLDENKVSKHTANIINGYFALEKGVSQKEKYLENEKVEIRAILPKNKKFIKWTSTAEKNIFENDADVNTTFIMPNKNIEIKAVFENDDKENNSGGGAPSVNYQTINAESGNGGTISPRGKLQLEPKTSKTFTITPDPGYEIADVLVDGKSVGAVSSYTFENVTADHTISATFKKKEDDPNADADALAQKIKAAKAVKLKASSSQGKDKKGKRYIKVKWTKKGAAITGYQVYRSDKKKSGFKKFYTTRKKYYYNTRSLKKGKRYYYKVRAYTTIDGKKYYSKWSNLAYRTVKK